MRLAAESREKSFRGICRSFREQQMQHLWKAADDLKLTYRTVQRGDFNNACTDVGDLSHLVSGREFYL